VQINNDNDNSAVLPAIQTDFMSQYEYSVIFVGSSVNPNVIISQDSTGDSWLRFVHAVENYGQVDIYVDRNPIFDNIGYKESSSYHKLTSQNHFIQIFNVGMSAQPLAEISITFDPLSYNTLTISGPTSNITARVFSDPIKSEVGAKFRLLNLIYDYPNTIEARMQLNNAPTVLATNAVYLQNNPYNPIPVGSNLMSIGPSQSSEDWIKFNYHFYNASYYTIFVMGHSGANSTVAITLLDTPTDLNSTKPPTKSTANPERIIHIFLILAICFCAFLSVLL